MNDMPWFRFFPSDWLGGTRGLTSSETGIYITLIAMMYERDGWLDANHSRLARLCGASNSAFSKAIETLLSDEKIIEKEGAYSNERVLEELSYRSKKETLARRAAKSRWQEKSTKSKGGVKRPHSVGNAIPEARGHIPDKKVKEDTNVSSKKRGTRLPDDWVPDIDFALELGLTRQQSEIEATKFREWWPAQPGQRGVKLDWGLTWKTWCRKAVERMPRHRSVQKPLRGSDFFFASAAQDMENERRQKQGQGGDWDDAGGIPFLTIEHKSTDG